MRFRAFDESGVELAHQVYFSIGGGFILREGETAASRTVAAVPYPFTSADELLRIGEERGMALWQSRLKMKRAGAMRRRFARMYNAFGM